MAFDKLRPNGGLVNTRILFFGRLAEQIGREREVDIPAAGCTIAELREQLALGEDILSSVDQAIAGDEMRVMPGQEIAFFSKLSGG